MSTSQSGFFHRKRTTKKNRIVSIASVPVTAMPYAEARRDRGAEADHERDHGGEDAPVDGGHVDLADLARRCGGCSGAAGSRAATAWRVTENAPEITACEAITVANVASDDHRDPAPLREGEEERVGDRARVLDDQGALAEVVERSARGRRGRTTRGGSAARPKWPMSAYSASAPVTASTTDAERDERRRRRARRRTATA